MYQSHSLKEDLKKSLGPEWISSRSGPGGAKLMYLEGKTAINLANELFGYDGWSSQVKESVVDFFDISDDGKINLGIATTVRVTLKDGTYHEDIGYGVADNMKTKASAFEKARKESTTDGMKRALRMFGNALGNCVYDKTYLRNISTMARSTAPFVPLELYRQEHIRKTLDPTDDNKPPPPPPPPTATTTTTTTKKEEEETTKPLLYSEDSFIIDDEDDEDFFARVAEAHADEKLDLETLQQLADIKSGPPVKRQRSSS